MYCEYWNLNKAPFDNVPDPSMYADCHESMEKVISETIFAIKEADEDFVVIIGAVGSGKTLALKMIIDSLEPHQYKSVVIKNPGIPFTQLLKEVIGQVTGAPCTENRKVHLLQTFHRLLFTTMEKGQKIIIFIDEADALSPANLENLRLLTNIQDDQRNLFALVLAGQITLAQRLEHPKRANLFQRIGVYGRIDKLPSEEAARRYIETRLKLAGTQIKIFPDESIRIIWENSDQGVPRLINKICKLCLIAGESNRSDYITPDLIRQVSERFQKLGRAALQKRKPRSIPDDFEISDIVEMGKDVINQLSIETDNGDALKPEYTEPVLQTAAVTESAEISPGPVISANEFQPGQLSSDDILSALSADNQIASSNPFWPETGSETEGLWNAAEGSMNGTSATEANLKQDRSEFEKLPEPKDHNDDEIMIGEHKVRLSIPKDILERVKSFNRDSAYKSAGFWAAQIIRKNPQLTRSPLADPVSIWNEIKDSILKKISM